MRTSCSKAALCLRQPHMRGCWIAGESGGSTLHLQESHVMSSKVEAYSCGAHSQLETVAGTEQFDYWNAVVNLPGRGPFCRRCARARCVAAAAACLLACCLLLLLAAGVAGGWWRCCRCWCCRQQRQLQPSQKEDTSSVTANRWAKDPKCAIFASRWRAATATASSPARRWPSFARNGRRCPAKRDARGRSRAPSAATPSCAMVSLRSCFVPCGL
jgi:hypothetical protein